MSQIGIDDVPRGPQLWVSVPAVLHDLFIEIRRRMERGEGTGERGEGREGRSIDERCITSL